MWQGWRSHTRTRTCHTALKTLIISVALIAGFSLYGSSSTAAPGGCPARPANALPMHRAHHPPPAAVCPHRQGLPELHG